MLLSHVLLYTCLLNACDASGYYQQGALVDPGLEVNFVSADLASRLELSVFYISVVITTSQKFKYIYSSPAAIIMKKI